jgi:hypothetical protein
MRRKRINHEVDIFCDMFSGWRLVNDMDKLIQLQTGQFTLDFIAKTVKLNGESYDNDLHMLTEIAVWFDRDLADNNIESASIRSATLVVEFISTVTEGKPKSRTKKIIEIILKMKSSILTDEKEYSANKEKTMEYHYIDKK